MARSPLSGRRVVITGPARGIGRRTAQLAAARGARLGLIGLEPERLAELARTLGDGHHWAECDVTDQASVDRAIAATVNALGGIDVVIANAGVTNSGTVAMEPADALVRTVDVNLNGVIRTVSAALPHVIAARGYVALVSSVAAFTGMPGMAAYCASKAGVEQFGNVLRLEVAPRGVAVGTVHPIWADTGLVDDFSAHAPAFEAARRRLPWPLRRVVPADMVAEAIVRGVERRRRRVFVPPSMAVVQALRTVVNSGVGDRINAWWTGGGTFVERLERQART